MQSELRYEEVIERYQITRAMIKEPLAKKEIKTLNDVFAALAEYLDQTIKNPDEITSAVVKTMKVGSNSRAQFESLTQALIRLRKKRQALDQKDINSDADFLRAVAGAASLLPVIVAASISPDLPDAIKTLKTDAGNADRKARNVRVDYLASMRQEAIAHPVLVVLHHITKTADSSQRAKIMRGILASLEGVASAIQDLTEAAEAPVIPRDVRMFGTRDVAPGAEQMTKAIEKSDNLSVWKLPFFIEQALEFAPQDERHEVLGVRQNALDRKNDDQLARKMVLESVETAAMLLSFTPVPGVALALSIAVGIARVAESIESYKEVATLYNASLDPAFLFLGDAADDPANPSMVVMDVAGLVLDVAGIGKVVRS